ncbi:MAG TPA: SDR family NAD(P)-dependent oxidoreductase [Pseudomonadales bacterium]|nr:SDR family NAD(P)-dependent oxidoreductase [Pseudomonadales bacterium]
MFEDKVVIVTGGAGALGRAVGRWFEERGARLAIIDYSDEIIDDAYPVRNPGHLYIACDLTRRAQCHEAVDTIQSSLGAIDVLCNIAGGFMMGQAVHETDDATWDFLFDLNARSVMNMAAAVVPGMLVAGRGKIVNVSARAGREGAALMGAYTASKAAVLRLTETMGQELREEGINVNCVMPSLIDTERNRQDMPGADFSRWVDPADIARVIGFLASDDASCIHGAGIPVDGLS